MGDPLDQSWAGRETGQRRKKPHFSTGKVTLKKASEKPRESLISLVQARTEGGQLLIQYSAYLGPSALGASEESRMRNCGQRRRV